MLWLLHLRMLSFYIWKARPSSSKNSVVSVVPIVVCKCPNSAVAPSKINVTSNGPLTLPWAPVLSATTPQTLPHLLQTQTPRHLLPGNIITPGPHDRESTHRQAAKSTLTGVPPVCPGGEHVFMDTRFSGSEVEHQGVMVSTLRSSSPMKVWNSQSSDCPLIPAAPEVRSCTDRGREWRLHLLVCHHHLCLSGNPQSHFSIVLSCLNALIELVLVFVKYCLFHLLSLNIIVYIGHFRCVTVNESWDGVTRCSQCLHSVA